MDEFVRRPAKPITNIDRSETNPRAEGVRSGMEVKPAPPEEPKKLDKEPQNTANKSPKKKFSFKNFKLPTPKSKRDWIIFGIITTILLGIVGYGVYYFIIRDSSPAPLIYVEPEPEPEPEPTTAPSVVSGREVALSAEQKEIYAVQIENSPDARPQSGLNEADIVTEAVAEGGITRFNAIYHDKVPANIGPVRSMRPYYIDWFLPYNAGAVHAGGSPEALNDILALRVQDMNHDSANFRRVSNRYAPHNLYTTGKQMVSLFNSKGYKNGKIPSLPRKEAEPAETPTASKIDLNISSALYRVNYTWDKKSNKYLRSMAGAPHVDGDSGKQLAPDVIVAPVLSKSNHPDGVHTLYGTVGSGAVFIFQDGKVSKGTWKKTSRSAQWQLLDAKNKPIPLNPGQTWFTIMDGANDVTYQP